MKKLLCALFLVSAIFAGCQKDTGTNVSIGSSDLAAINGQLKGTWVFPVETFSILDTTGKALAPSQNLSASAFRFDGNTSVDIMPDLHTIVKGTYILSTEKGYIYLEVVYPNGNGVKYLVTLLDKETLKLNSTQAYTYYNGNTPVPANAVFNTSFKKQNSADATGNLARVAVMSDSLYNVGVYITHNVEAPADTAILLNSKINVTGEYSYSFIPKAGDHITVDIFGSLTKTSFFVYYNGIPLTGQVDSGYGEIRSGNGWDIP